MGMKREEIVQAYQIACAKLGEKESFRRQLTKDMDDLYSEIRSLQRQFEKLPQGATQVNLPQGASNEEGSVATGSTAVVGDSNEHAAV